jgi:hypothetical protein
MKHWHDPGIAKQPSVHTSWLFGFVAWLIKTAMVVGCCLYKMKWFHVEHDD